MIRLANINTNKLKGRMTETGLTQKDVATLMGISSSTLNKKINGKGRDLTIPEATMLIDILKIQNPLEYFFVTTEVDLQDA